MWMLLPALAWAAFPDHAAPHKSGARSEADAAVVIAIEDYFALPDVPFATRDGDAMRDLFVYTLGVPSDRVEQVAHPASKERIEAALDRAAGLVGEEGTVWVYFAGHGAASPSTGERVLLGADTLADAASFEARALSLDDVRERLGEAGERTVLMVDACYSGTGRAGADLLPGKRFAVPAYAAPPAPRWVEWHAAGPDQLSGPLEVAEHGAFTWAVIGALRGWADGQLDDTRDGTVTFDEAALYVEEALRTVGVRDQTPVLKVTDRQQPLWAAERLEPAPDLVASLAEATRPPPAPAPVVAPPPPPPAPVAPPEPSSLCIRRVTHSVGAGVTLHVTADGAPFTALGNRDDGCFDHPGAGVAIEGYAGNRPKKDRTRILTLDDPAPGATTWMLIGWTTKGYDLVEVPEGEYRTYEKRALQKTLESRARLSAP